MATFADQHSWATTNVSNKGGTWQEFEVGFDQVYQKKQVIQHGFESIWAYAQQLLTDVTPPFERQV